MSNIRDTIARLKRRQAARISQRLNLMSIPARSIEERLTATELDSLYGASDWRSNHDAGDWMDAANASQPARKEYAR